jgi:hypothetical protein
MTYRQAAEEIDDRNIRLRCSDQEVADEFSMVGCARVADKRRPAPDLAGLPTVVAMNDTRAATIHRLVPPQIVGESS